MRSRAFLDVPDGHGGRGGELLAYDDGRWEVRLYPIGDTVALGTESTGDQAMLRAVAVYEALTKLIKTARCKYCSTVISAIHNCCASCADERGP